MSGTPTGPATSLTEDQLDRALEYVGYPKANHASDPLHRLRQLMLHHVERVPFENIGIHYSPTHKLSLKLDDLFDKLVVRGKGGYCLELNALFAAILRGLGYTVLTVGGRVRAGNPRYGGWGHMCLIVTIDGIRYVVDVGYGADGNMQPVPLVSGTEFTVLAPRRGKLEYRSLEFHTESTQRLWVYSTRDSMEDDSEPWREQYCFVETEYFQADYEAMNFFTSSSPTSFFAGNVLAARAVLGDDKESRSSGSGDKRLAGVLTFFNDEVRKRTEGSLEKVVVEKVATEAERIAAFEKWFRIHLAEEDRRGIFTTALALDKEV